MMNMRSMCKTLSRKRVGCSKNFLVKGKTVRNFTQMFLVGMLAIALSGCVSNGQCTTPSVDGNCGYGSAAVEMDSSGVLIAMGALLLIVVMRNKKD